MNREQRLVLDMMRKLKLKLPYQGNEGPGIDRLTSKHIKLLKNLVEEEHKEFQDWMEGLDIALSFQAEENGEFTRALVFEAWVQVIDAMCDMIVTIHNTSNAMNLDLEKYFNEVHRSNMTKADGPMREDGKRLKPKGWTPPKIGEILKDELRRYYNMKNRSPDAESYFTSNPFVAFFYELIRDYKYEDTVLEIISEQKTTEGWYLTDHHVASVAREAVMKLQEQGYTIAKGDKHENQTRRRDEELQDKGAQS